MKVPAESNPDNELFTFFPRETTDKKRISEILDTVYTSKAPSGKLYKGKRLTVLGKEVAKILAIKATEFPFLRIFHYYKNCTFFLLYQSFYDIVHRTYFIFFRIS